MAASTESYHELLQVISGRSALRSEDQIREILTRSHSRLVKGLQFFKEPSAASAAKLKNDGSIGKTSQEFTLKLSKYLGLDEWQSHELLQIFLMTTFRGTSKQLQAIINEDRNANALILKISEYYFSERLSALHCLKHLLSFWQEDRHPYKPLYLDCVEDMMLDDALVSSMWDQYNDACSCLAPTRETHGQLMNERQSLRWSIQYLREQVELLECLVLYFRFLELQPGKLLETLKLFQRQGYGTRQPNRHLYDGDATTEELVNKIGFLCCMLVIEGMDIYWIHDRTGPDRADDNVLIKDRKTLLEIDKYILSRTNLTHPHGPILLCWAVLRSMAMPDDPSHAIRKLGQQALQLQAFQYISTMLDTPLFATDSSVSMTCVSQLNGLLSLVLSGFHEDSLGDMTYVVACACKLLKKPHICHEFWDYGGESGMSILLQSLTSRFPLQFIPLVQLLTSISAANPGKTFRHLDNLSQYLELLDNNRAVDMQSYNDGEQWRLLRNKVIYRPDGSSAGLVMPRETIGTMYDDGQELQLISWDWNYSGWQLFVGKIDSLLKTAGRSVGYVSETEVKEVNCVIDLVGKMLESDWAISTRLKPIISRLYLIIQTFTSADKAVLGLLASCVKCLSLVAKHHPLEVWKNIQQTGFLPYTGKLYTDVAMAASGAGIFPGNYGNLLGGNERPMGLYSVTKAFLQLVAALVQGLSEQKTDTATKQDILACVIFVQWEVFASFYKWRYVDVRDREDIGRKSLEIFHIVLNVMLGTSEQNDMDTEPAGQKQGVAVRDAVVHGLLYTNAGEALLHILATGVDAIEARCSETGSFLNSSAQDLTQLIKLAFSVTNRLLILKPQQTEMSPLEQELTEQNRTILQQIPLIVTMAGYIYHRHDPKLPTLSTLLLKRLAMVAPMSIYGSLGIQAEAIRDSYQTRLQAFTEDTRLKVVILEFLTAAVETQPGLIELFLDLEVRTDDPTNGKTQQQQQQQQQLASARTRIDSAKEFQLGKISALQTVLDMITLNKQGTTHCPPELHAAALAFLYALWQDRRDTALAVLRKRPKFWENVAGPLFKDLSANNGSGGSREISAEVKTVAYAMKIISAECYYITSGSVDKELKDQLKRLQQEKRYTFWSNFIRELVVTTEAEDDPLEDYLLFDHETLLMLSAWKMMTLVAANTAGAVMCLSDEATKNSILSDIIAAVKRQVADVMSSFRLKATSLLSNLYLTLLRQWPGCHAKQWNKLTDVVWILEHTKFGVQESLGRMQIALLSAITVLVQSERERSVLSQKEQSSRSIEKPLLGRLLPLVCLAIQQISVIVDNEIMSSAHPPWASRSGTLETMETEVVDAQNQPEENKNHSHIKKYNLPIVGVCCLDELIGVVDGPETWLPLIRQHSLVQLLLTTLQTCLQKRQGLYFAEAAMNLLLDMSYTLEAAEAISNSGFTQYTCIAFTNTYQKNSDASVEVNGHVKQKNADKTDQVTWLSVYRQALTVVASMLATLKHSFLGDALNFFGVHQDRMTQCLNVVKNNHSPACLLEAERTILLLYQLAHFSREWRFQMPEELTAIQITVCYLVQNCTALLIRPRLLQHRLQHSPGSHIPQEFHRPTGAVGSSIRLQHQGSTEDVETPSPELMTTQARLINIVGNAMSMLRLFNPDLLEILLNVSLDVSEYVVLFNLGFSTPSIDQDSPPSFGCLVACINMCVRILYKLDGSKIGLSPLKSPEKSPARSTWDDSPIHRHRVLHLLENTLLVIMCQGMRYLKEPEILPREKQLLKRELGAELSTFLMSLQRYFRRGGPGSPGDANPGSTATTPLTSSSSKSSLHGAFIDAQEQAFFRVVNLYVQQVLR